MRSPLHSAYRNTTGKHHWLHLITNLCIEVIVLSVCFRAVTDFKRDIISFNKANDGSFYACEWLAYLLLILHRPPIASGDLNLNAITSTGSKTYHPEHKKLKVTTRTRKESLNLWIILSWLQDELNQILSVAWFQFLKIVTKFNVQRGKTKQSSSTTWKLNKFYFFSFQL